MSSLVRESAADRKILAVSISPETRGDTSVLLSMTGFGEARRQSQLLAVAVEIRAVNSRYFKCSVRTTEGYGALEPRIEPLVRQRIRRGTVQLNLRVERFSTADDFRINEPVLSSYIDQIHALAQNVPWDAVADLPLGSILLLPGVVDEGSRSAASIEEDWPLVSDAVSEALEELSKMRAQEGRALEADLNEQCESIAANLAEVASRAPQVVADYQTRLAERVDQSLKNLNVSVEPSDLIREVSLFADRSDISEEIVRLRSHLEQFRATMVAGESTGRKLEFIGQEMGREVNTIGSKANDSDIARHVVEMKTALERIREQVQNIE